MSGLGVPVDGPGCQHGHHDRHHCAQNADHLAHNTRFSPFFAEVVCTLGTTPPQTATSPPPNGGNGVIRTTTRRRHADSQPLVLQNPHRHRHGGHRRDLPPCRWAVAGPGRASRRRAERSSRRGRLAGGPPPTGTHSGRGRRRPQHPWGRKQRLVSYNPTSRYAQESIRRPRPAGAGRGQQKMC